MLKCKKEIRVFVHPNLNSRSATASPCPSSSTMVRAVYNPWALTPGMTQAILGSCVHGASGSHPRRNPRKGYSGSCSWHRNASSGNAR